MKGKDAPRGICLYMLDCDASCKVIHVLNFVFCCEYVCFLIITT